MNELRMQGSETDRLVFDYITERESEQWLEFYRDKLNRLFLGVDKFSPELAWEKRLEREAWRLKYGLGSSALLRIKESNEPIGSCGLLIQNIEGCCILEIGYALFQSARGKGYVTEAAQACMDRATKLSIATAVHSIIHYENQPSMAVAQRIGMSFKEERSFKGFRVHLFQKRLK